LTRCDTHAAITGSVGLGPVDVAKNILDILNRASDDVEVQTRLFDLLGADGFEFIGFW
jgi:hypothetical protein